ncbi:MAG: KTSC domain-containing protein [Syntrophales bacterium]
MERQPVKSTNVDSVGYDPESKTLTVEFKSGGIYQYAGVQPEMYADLLAAESVGRFVSQVVRAGRKGLRIEEKNENAAM